MKIIKLQAENFKRLSAVEIAPDGNLVVISGANDQGKSSVLESIMATLCGGRGMKDIPEPIRRGEDRAEVVLDLGDIRVRRIWEPGKNRVEVTNADGAKYQGPQGILDALTGSLTFDPLEFARMQPRDQRATLLRLVELPFDIDDNDRQRSALVQAETASRQEVKRAESISMPVVPEETPDEEISASELLRELQNLRDIIAENNRKRGLLNDARIDYANAEAGVKVAQESVRMLERQLADAKADLADIEKALEAKRERGKQLAEQTDMLVDPDTSKLDAKLAALDETNRNVRQKKANEAARQSLKDARIAETTAKNAVTAHDRARADALAGAKFPVDGLGFDEDGVTLNGFPFSQASESQRIMASAAMGMAMNSRLRVMFVRDGSALDSKRMEALAELAADMDYQLWIEKVDETGAVGIVIEDGRVANDNAPVQEKRRA